MKRHWPIFIVILLAVVAFKQSSRIHARGVERKELEAQLETLDAELATISNTPTRSPVVSAADAVALRQRAEPVHQLRGDVTMSRKELEKIQTTLAQLAKQYEARSNQLAFAESPVFPENYRQGSALQNVGQTSPEATLETFFHATIVGDIDLASPCLDEMAGQKNLDAAAKQRTADQVKQMFARFPGYQLVTREQLTPTRTRLGIRTSPESKTIHIVLDLTDRQWVINAHESELFK
jgi:hypothetical protein